MIIIAWVFLCFVVGAMGASRSIGFFLSFILSLFLSPVIGVIFVLLSKRNSTTEYEKTMLELQRKTVENTKSQTQPVQTKSRADLLRDLTKIRDEGLITQEEFQERKNKILS